MNRETKVGIVVACSFLVLVGIVVASKWRRGEDPSGAEEQTAPKVAAIKPTQNNGGDAKKEGAKNEQQKAGDPKKEAPKTAVPPLAQIEFDPTKLGPITIGNVQPADVPLPP